MKGAMSSSKLILGKSIKTTKKEYLLYELFSLLIRSRDSVRPCMFLAVPLSDNCSVEKLQLKGHIQNYQGDGL